MRYIVFLIFLGVACKNVEKTPDYISLSFEKFGSDDVECLSNEEESLVLCVHNGQRDVSLPRELRFFVYSKEKGIIIYERDIDQGSVKWKSSEELRLVRTPGTMRANETIEDYTFIVNVLTGKERKVRR